MDNRPIGVFDSGLGGLTGVRELRKRLPNENIVYFGDTGRVPYGSRSPEIILQYTRQDIAFLLSKDVKCIMAACGTVSSTYPAAEAAQLPVPYLGVVDAAARELTAGGRGCTAAFAGLPGYPGALAADTDGTLYISYRWARSSWLEKNADSTLLRGIALRAGQNTQERLFRCTADAPCAEAVSLATGAWEQTFTGLAQDSCAAVCPVESKVYFGAAGADSLLAANR